jgi:Zn-dependent protease
MISIACPKCRSNIAVDDLPGAIAACSQCGARILLPRGDGSQAILLSSPSGEPATETPQPSDVIDTVVSPQDEAVLAEVQRLQDQRPGWGNAISILVISVLLFLGAQAGGAWEGIVILMGVLAFHESGHYVAMRCFGYRNLKMFFIPFFGAAVSGRHYNVAGWQKALVALAGPVPGIALGVAVGVLGLALKEPLLIQVALALLILNGYNLLPFLPLDGGWAVHAVLFVRHPVLDGIFRLVAALGLLGLALLTGNWVLVGLAVFMLIAVPLSWRLANIAHRLRQQGLVAISADAESIPLSAALTILAAVRPALPPQTSPKVLAQHVANMFGALNAQPPGVLATLGLLALHAGSFLVALVMTVVIMMLKKG